MLHTKGVRLPYSCSNSSRHEMLADDDDEPSIDELIYEATMCDGPRVRTTKFVDVVVFFPVRSCLARALAYSLTWMKNGRHETRFMRTAIRKSNGLWSCLASGHSVECERERAQKCKCILKWHIKMPLNFTARCSSIGGDDGEHGDANSCARHTFNARDKRLDVRLHLVA